MSKTAIEWTATVNPDGSVTPGSTWNPVTGCSKVSPGCAHCYAETVALRFWPSQYPPVEYDTYSVDNCCQVTEQRARQFTDVQWHEDRLEQPLRWRKPRRVFVNSMSDLFHESVPDAFIDRVFAVMALAAQHTFQVLTKRAERMRTYMSDPSLGRRVWTLMNTWGEHDGFGQHGDDLCYIAARVRDCWPLPNVWLGVSVENQHFADERIPLLLQTPAAVRFVSAEPLLEKVLLDNGETSWFTCTADNQQREGTDCCMHRVEHGHGHFRGIDWVIVGGESGRGARPLWVPWVRSIVQQCQAAGVKVFVKQLGADVRDRNDAGFTGDFDGSGTCWPEQHAIDDRIEHDLDGTRDGYQGAPVRIHLKSRKGGDPSEWPADLRVREFPEASR